jgi:hypothetical protein
MVIKDSSKIYNLPISTTEDIYYTRETKLDTGLGIKR